MKVVIAGAHGLLGSALTRLLIEHGWSVHTLVRRESRSPREISWDPNAGKLDPASLAEFDAVVNLGGASLARLPWSAAYRREILQSRTTPTALLARTMAKLDSPPPVWLQGSAVGFYGDQGSSELTEKSSSGEGFLSEVVQRWESMTAPAERAGVRVVHLRTGSMALARNGGSSALLLRAIKFGVGGPLGPGTNWWSWITVPDHAAAALHLMTSPVHGPVNLTAPSPATQREVVSALAHALHRPAFVRVPANLLRLALHDVADELLLSSQRALPTVLEDSGFHWQHPTLERAARWVAGQD